MPVAHEFWYRPHRCIARPISQTNRHSPRPAYRPKTGCPGGPSQPDRVMYGASPPTLWAAVGIANKACDLAGGAIHNTAHRTICLPSVAMFASSLQRILLRNRPEFFWKPAHQGTAPNAAFRSFAGFGLHDGRVCIAIPKQPHGPCLLPSSAIHRNPSPARWRDEAGSQVTSIASRDILTDNMGEGEGIPGALVLRHLRRLPTVIS